MSSTGPHGEWVPGIHLGYQSASLPGLQGISIREWSRCLGRSCVSTMRRIGGLSPAFAAGRPARIPAAATQTISHRRARSAMSRHPSPVEWPADRGRSTRRPHTSRTMVGGPAPFQQSVCGIGFASTGTAGALHRPRPRPMMGGRAGSGRRSSQPVVPLHTSRAWKCIAASAQWSSYRDWVPVWRRRARARRANRRHRRSRPPPRSRPASSAWTPRTWSRSPSS